MPVRQEPGAATARVWQAPQSSSCRDRQGGQQMGSWERQQQQAEERSDPVLQGTCSVLASCWSCSKQLQLAVASGCSSLGTPVQAPSEKGDARAAAH